MLRLEDTDQSRLVPGAAESIEDMLEWAGEKHYTLEMFLSSRVSILSRSKMAVKDLKMIQIQVQQQEHAKTIEIKIE